MLSIKLALLAVLAAVAADVALFDGATVWIVGAMLGTLALAVHRAGCRVAAEQAAEQAAHKEKQRLLMKFAGSIAQSPIPSDSPQSGQLKPDHPKAQQSAEGWRGA